MVKITDHPHIAVIGAGAIGSLVGGILARHGHQVTLVGKKAHIEAVKANGLCIDGVAGDFTVALDAAETLNFEPDLTFIAVKNQDVRDTCRSIQAMAGRGPVVMMQNGVTSARTSADFFGEDRVIGCTLMLNTRFLTPGRVTYANKGPNVIGKPFTENDATVAQLQALLNKVAPTMVSGDILGVQWTKLMVNAMSNALDGMTGLDFGTCMHHRPLRRIGVLIIKEAYGLMRSAGIRPAPIPGLPVFFFKILVKVPTPLGMWLLKITAQSKTSGKIITSTLQSLLKGRRTEIDYLNGEFVTLGKKLSLPTPINAKVVELIHEIEKTGQFFTPAALRDRFTSMP